MIEATAEHEFILSDADFPADFVDMAHPFDDQDLDTAPEPEFFEHTNGDNHSLFARVAFRLTDDNYRMVSFVIDTGAPAHLYLSPKTSNALQPILQTDMEGRTTIKIMGQECKIQETPSSHQPANIMGLKMIKMLGGILFLEDGTFRFLKSFRQF